MATSCKGSLVETKMQIREIIYHSVYDGDKVDVYDEDPRLPVADVRFYVDGKVDTHTLMGIAAKIIEINLGEVSPKYTLQLGKGYSNKYKGREYQFWVKENETR